MIHLHSFILLLLPPLFVARASFSEDNGKIAFFSRSWKSYLREIGKEACRWLRKQRSKWAICLEFLSRFRAIKIKLSVFGWAQTTQKLIAASDISLILLVEDMARNFDCAKACKQTESERSAGNIVGAKLSPFPCHGSEWCLLAVWMIYENQISTSLHRHPKNRKTKRKFLVTLFQTFDTLLIPPAHASRNASTKRGKMVKNIISHGTISIAEPETWHGITNWKNK